MAHLLDFFLSLSVANMGQPCIVRTPEEQCADEERRRGQRREGGRQLHWSPTFSEWNGLEFFQQKNIPLLLHDRSPRASICRSVVSSLGYFFTNR
uniref:Secreted protein n=1 Tax=Rhipicephalus appendiculatus TaxID=34631 RepID=A0A131YYI4_RHIAP